MQKIEDNKNEKKESIENNIFVSEELNKKFNVKFMSLEDLLNLLNLAIYENVTLKYLFDISKKLPASSRGYHGDYAGGLYDHILLVTNYSLINFTTLKNPDFTLQDITKSALYHDFEKIVSYTPKYSVEFNFNVYAGDKDDIRGYIYETYQLKGQDKHIEVCLALIKKLKLQINENIEKAIIFHHGGWSQFKPIRRYGISALLHGADMIASQTLNI